MTNALVFDVPLELRLELMPVVRPHLSDTEREVLDDVVEDGDGIGLGAPALDLESPDAGGFVYGGMRVALDRFAIFSSKD